MKKLLALALFCVIPNVYAFKLDLTLSYGELAANSGRSIATKHSMILGENQKASLVLTDTIRVEILPKAGEKQVVMIVKIYAHNVLIASPTLLACWNEKATVYIENASGITINSAEKLIIEVIPSQDVSSIADNENNNTINANSNLETTI